jgi:hypothetical protein
MATYVNSVYFVIVAKTNRHDMRLASRVDCCQPSKTLALQKFYFCLRKIAHCAAQLPFTYEMFMVDNQNDTAK